MYIPFPTPSVPEVFMCVLAVPKRDKQMGYSFAAKICLLPNFFISILHISIGVTMGADVIIVEGSILLTI
jgi:hypothetical protein